MAPCKSQMGIRFRKRKGRPAKKIHFMQIKRAISEILPAPFFSLYLNDNLALWSNLFLWRFL